MSSVGVGVGIAFQVGNAGVVVPAEPAILASIDALGGFAAWDGTPPADPSGYTLTVNRQGYDAVGSAITWAQTIKTTVLRRQAWPNQANNTASGVALSHVVYSGDTVEAPALITNSSTQNSPRPIFEWTMHDRTVVGNIITLQCTAYHIFGVAAVVFTVTDTDGGSVTATVSTQTMRICPRSGFAIGEYVATIDISALSETLGTTPGMISANAEVFPRVGTATYNTTVNGTSIGTPRRLIFRKHAAMAAAPVYAYWQVGATGGVANENEATARAAPSPTLELAMSRAAARNNTVYGINAVDGVRLRPLAGATLVAATADKTMIIAAPIMETDSIDVSPFSFPARDNFNCRITGALGGGVGANTFIFRNLTINRSNTTNFLQNQNNSLSVYFDNCTVNAGSGVTGNIGAISPQVVWTKSFDTHFTNINSPNWLNAANNPMTALIGCTATNMNGNGVLGYNVQGCNLPHGRVTTGTAPVHQFVVTSSYIGSYSSGSNNAFARSSNMSEGTIVANVVFEEISGVQNNRFAFSADGATTNSDHVLIWHVTSAGGGDTARFNACYNDVAGTNRLQRNWSMVGVLFKGRVPWKSDTFVQDGGDYTGNWNFGNGVNCRGNWSGGVRTSSQFIEYWGENSVVAVTTLNPLFVNDQSSEESVASAGGGDYNLQSGSPAKSIVNDTPMPWNILGAVRPTTNADAGAY